MYNIFYFAAPAWCSWRAGSPSRRRPPRCPARRRGSASSAAALPTQQKILKLFYWKHYFIILLQYYCLAVKRFCAKTRFCIVCRSTADQAENILFKILFYYLQYYCLAVKRFCAKTRFCIVCRSAADKGDIFFFAALSVRDNRGRPGLMPDRLQPIPDAGKPPSYQW